jgi:hypothetical protein
VFDRLDDLAGADTLERGTNVAVVGDPYVGRSVLLDHFADALDADVHRESLDGVIEESPSFPGRGAVVVDDCQYLYTREVGGFDALEEFLDRAAVSDRPFVTAWNRYAWRYLTAVRDVSESFTEVVKVPRAEPEGIAALLLSSDETDPEFVETDDEGPVGVVDLEWRELSLPGGRTASVPGPELNAEYLTSHALSWSGRMTDAEAVVFQKVARASRGNPGVATAIWERSVRDGTVAPAYVDAGERELQVDEDEAFVLELLLAKGALSIEALSSVLARLPVQRVVQSLADRGHVLINDRVTLAPGSLRAVVDYLGGRRLVW